VKLLELDLAPTHPIVLVWLACGTPPIPRSRTLDDIGLLKPAQQASLREVWLYRTSKTLRAWRTAGGRGDAGINDHGARSPTVDARHAAGQHGGAMRGYAPAHAPVVTSMRATLVRCRNAWLNTKPEHAPTFFHTFRDDELVARPRP
jgi:hypothetical protein